jgi:hypothetical protein
MPFLNHRVLNRGLHVLEEEATELHLCSQEPTTYTQAITTYSVAVKVAPNVSAPANRTPDGRKVTVPEITDGDMTADDEATHWALVDTVNERLLATNALVEPIPTEVDGIFALDAFDIGIPDAVSE